MRTCLKRSSGITLATLLLATPAVALACDAGFGEGRVRADADEYDGFRNDGQFTEIALEIVNVDPNGACSLLVFFDGIEPMRGDEATLNWQLVRSRGAVGVIRNSPPQPGPDQDSVATAVGPGGRITVSVFAYLPPSQLLPPGLYGDSFSATLVDVTDDAFTIVTEATVDLTAQVIDRIDLSLAGELGALSAAGFSSGERHGSVTDVDFGMLDSLPASRLVRVWVLSNSSYWFTMSSENGGVMRHAADGAARLAYEATLDGQTVDLTREVTRHYNRPDRGLRDHPLRFTIRSIEGLPPGDYEDFVRITVTTHH